MRVILLILCVWAFIPVSGQNKVFLDEKTVVKDSAGTIYPHAIWQELLFKGYSLKPVNPKDPSTEYLLVKLTEEQAKSRAERAPKPRESPYFKTGEKADLFKTTDIDEKKIDLRDSSGKIIVLNFWFINCSPCRKEIPDLNTLVDSFSTTGKVLFYAIALDKKDEVKTFLEKLPFKYTIIDNGRFIADKYGINSYPTHAVIDTEGRVYFHTVGLGMNTVHWLRKSINELLDKKPL